ncbi:MULTISPECIES: nuclear transport factor 2 family protein [unclassified Geodermatophilus]
MEHEGSEHEGSASALRGRSSRDVLTAHLDLRKAGDLERDLRENYSPRVVVLTARQVFRGHEGVRRSAHRLWAAIGHGGAYAYSQVLADDRMCLLEWRGGDDHVEVRCGVDSYLIEDGWITAQTIHYRVDDLDLSTYGPQVSADPDRLPFLTAARPRPS